MPVSSHTCAWFYVKDSVSEASFKAHLEMIYFHWKVMQFFSPKNPFTERLQEGFTVFWRTVKLLCLKLE